MRGCTIEVHEDEDISLKSLIQNSQYKKHRNHKQPQSVYQTRQRTEQNRECKYTGDSGVINETTFEWV